MVRLILASASDVRRKLLADAGIAFEVVAAAIDEAPIKHRHKAAGDGVEAAAEALALAKARAVSRENPGALVIGADQILEQDGHWFDKPADRDAARAHLRAFSGRVHRLVTAAAVCENGEPVWRDLAVATLRVRKLSPDFIESYLDAVGDLARQSVGAYQLESRGIQLFEQIDGDFFTILGLPLLPLLTFLRQRGMIEA